MERSIAIRAPGPTHHGRWMHLFIYLLKIFGFRDQLILLEEERDNITKFLQFFLQLYLKAWYTAPIAAEAPRRDLELLKQIDAYKAVNTGLAAVALKKFSNHLWYINEKNICLALFDKDVTDATKQSLATAVLTSTVQPTKTRRSSVDPAKIQQLELSNFITRNSKQFFTIIGETYSFLEKHPSEWANDDTYKSAYSVVKSIKVTNDSAERGVHLMTEFDKLLTKDKKQQQYLLRGVHERRKAKPSCNKSKLCK